MNNNVKRIRTLVSSLMADDTDKITSVVNELIESTLSEKESKIMDIITESFTGEIDV